MSWISVSVATKNGSTYSKTLLLNTKKFGQIVAVGSLAEFYYEEDWNTIHKFTTSSLTRDQLVLLVTTEQDYDNRVSLDVLGLSTVKKVKLSDEDLLSAKTEYNVEVDQLVWGYDIGSTSTCYVLFRTGKKSILYKVNSTIAELEAASSTSVSVI